MKVILKIFLVILFFNLSFAGWQGARMIDGSFPNGSLGYAIATDNFGVPWVIWKDSGGPMFTKWNGSDWEEPRRAPDTIHAGGSYIDFIFNQVNNLFLIYPFHDDQNHVNIFSTLYDPVSDTWGLPQQVNDPDTTILDDFYPRISFGGGEIWATWFNENGDSVICNIKASHWNRNILDWEPEMTVNPDSGGINRLDWFPDVTVDTTGTPHIVWIQATPTSERIRYSNYENERWTEPIFITNPDSVIPTGPYGGVRPKLVVDNQNILHCVFPGYRPDSSPVRVRVYYTENSGSDWKTPVAFDTFSSPNDPVWESDIAADRPDNIWFVWDRGGGSDWKIYASHFGSSGWSPEERIDDGITYQGGFPKIALDGTGNPFVIWAADTTRSGDGYAVYYNRYVSSAIEEKNEKLSNFRFISSFNRIEIKYTLQYQDHIKVKVYDINGRLVGNLLDELQEAGDHTLTWNRKISQGIYFIHIETSNQTYRAKTVIFR